MTRINLLPHREMRRERRRKDFVAQAVMAGVLGALVAVVVAVVIDSRIEAQQARNRFIQHENRKLDSEIKEIAQLHQEIEDLKARQQAVEDLQRERTLPVHVLDDLVRYTPSGIYFKQIKQQDHKVSMVGMAQSNERVSNLLHNLSTDAPWLERPELVEIKAIHPGKSETRDARSGYEFSVNAFVKGLPSQVPAGLGTPAAKPAAGAAPSQVSAQASGAKAAR